MIILNGETVEGDCQLNVTDMDGDNEVLLARTLGEALIVVGGP